MNVDLASRPKTEPLYALGNPNVKINNPPGMVMMDAAEMENIPWTYSPLLPGMGLKYIHVDLDKGIAVALLKIGAGVRFPVHVHFGTSMLFCLKGRFSYMPAGTIGPGGFGYEPFGVIHEPDTTTAEETLMWAINSHNECIQFYADDGSLGEIQHLAGNLRRIRDEYGFDAVKHLTVPEGFWDD